MKFKNRQAAGKQLARTLLTWKKEKPVILALPRGGVPVAYEVAQAFKALLDVLVAHKIGAPWSREFGIGAVGETVKKLHAKHIIFAVPVCAASTAQALKAQVDDLVCSYTPSSLESIGAYYTEFYQVSDKAVITLLDAANTFSSRPILYLLLLQDSNWPGTIGI